MERSPHLERGAFWLIVALGIWLRLRGLATESFWLDESWSWWFVDGSFGALLEHLRGDVHPPLYFALLWAWEKLFGETEWALRSLSAVLSSACLVPAYGVGLRLRDRSLGLVFMALFAVAPFQIYYAQEVRSYALYCLLALANTWAFLELARGEGTSRLGRIAAYGLSLGLLAWTHYFSIFLPILHGIALIGSKPSRQLWKQYAASIGIAAAASAPVVLFLSQQLANVEHLPHFAPFGLAQLHELSVFWSPFMSYRLAAPQLFPLLQSVAGILYLAGLWVVARRWQEGLPRSLVLVGGVLLIPLVAGLMEVKQVYVFRNMSGLQMFGLLPIAAALRELLSHPRAKPIGAILLASIVLLGVVRYEPDVIYRKTEWRHGFEVVRTRMQDGDIVAMYSPYDFHNVRYYSRDSLPGPKLEPGDNTFRIDPLRAVHDAGVQLQIQMLSALLTQTSTGRLWLLEGDFASVEPVLGYLRETPESRLFVEDVTQGKGLRVFLVTRSPASLTAE